MEGVKGQPTVEFWVDDHQEYEPGIVTGDLRHRGSRSILGPATTWWSATTKFRQRWRSSSAVSRTAPYSFGFCRVVRIVTRSSPPGESQHSPRSPRPGARGDVAPSPSKDAGGRRDSFDRALDVARLEPDWSAELDVGDAPSAMSRRTYRSLTPRRSATQDVDQPSLMFHAGRRR